MAKSWNEVCREVSKRMRKDPELRKLQWDEDDVYRLHMHLWTTLEYYMRNADKAKSGILINGFLKIKFREFYIDKMLSWRKLSKEKAKVLKKIKENIERYG